ELEEVEEPAGLAELWQVFNAGADGRELWSSSSVVVAGGAYRHRDSDLAFDHGPVVRLRAGTAVDAERATLRRADLVLVSVLPLCYLMAMVGVWAVVRRETRPLVRMSHAASTIDPDRRTSAPAFHVAGSHAQEVDALGQALDAMLERLVDGLERERCFAAAAAHELRTPLAQLITGLEVAVRRERDAESYRRALAGALADGQRLAGLIDAVLYLARSEQAHVDGFCAIDDVVGICRELAVDPLVDQLFAGAVTVRGDQAHWRLILGNLIENGRHHGGGAIEVALMISESKSLIMTVSDHGPGVAPSERERIFRPLVCLDQARTIGADRQGYGLGLAIVASAVRNVGGSVVCTSRDDAGSGASFRVDVPLL
ncbi:MAG: sensor histidine kinase, partial [Planctomycetota bacterium]